MEWKKVETWEGQPWAEPAYIPHEKQPLCDARAEPTGSTIEAQEQ